MAEKIIIINEKPSQYEAFTKALGGQTGSFDGREYAVMHLFGHILGNPVPEKTAKKEYREKVGKFSNIQNIPWDWRWFNFNHKVLKDKNFKSVLNNLSGYLNAGYIPVIASDIDRSGEGDLLVWEALIALNYTGKVYREYHDDEEADSIIKALKNMKVVNQNDPQFRAAWARSAMDFMTQSLTRVSTMKLINQGYHLDHVVPIGRLQSAIMILVGDQNRAIKAYKPSTVYESRYKLGDLVLSHKDMPRFKTKEEWQAGDLPEKSMVKEVKQVPGKTIPPKAMTLSNIVGAMSKKGMGVKKTIATVQKMYEAHYITYPRTEDHFVTPEQFEKMAPNVDTILNVLNLPVDAFTHRAPRKTHVRNGASHGALRPGGTIPKSLSELDEKFGKGASEIYRQIGNRYMMMYLEDTEWVRHEYQTIDTPEPFKGSITIITKRGVMDPDKPNKDEGKTLPDLGQPAEIYAHPIKSKKPSKPTVDWLTKQLEKYDVGTEATRSQTIARLSDKSGKLPLKEGKALTLTKLGELGYLTAQGTEIGSIDGTKYLGHLIDKVRDGADYDTVFDEFGNVLTKDIQTIENKEINLSDLGFEKKAPKELAKGTWNGQEVSFNRNFAGHHFTDEEVEKLLAGDEIEIMCQTKNGEKKVIGKLAEQEYKGHKFIGFKGHYPLREGYVRGTWQGKAVTFKGSFMDHKFTDSELTALQNGEDIKFDTHKEDKTYHVHGKLALQDYQGHKFVGFKPQFEMPKRDGYVQGMFKGTKIQFKGEFMKHKFSPDEIEDLLAGNSITFTGTTKNDKEMSVSGKLAKQSYQGHSFYGFKADFGNKKKK